MAPLLQTLLLSCIVDTIQAKLFGRCELAHVLKDGGMDGYEGYNLANWLCMTFFETGFDSEAIDRRPDGTKDYGIFHINSGWWCKDGNDRSASQNLCSVKCADLLDSKIDDDMRCVKRIVQDPEGMGVWYENLCVSHCMDEEILVGSPQAPPSLDRSSLH